LSRVLGFLRDLVIARMFGADAATDAFFVAFKIPNFLRRLFAEGAFSVAFVPVLSEYRSRRSKAELKAFIDRMAGTFGLILLATTLAGVLAAPLLIMLFAPGFVGEDDAKYRLAVEMLYLTFPYLFFISLTAFAGSILNAHNRFGIPAFTPVLLNLSLIGCALWLSPQMNQPITALAWGVLIAGATQLLFQFPFLGRLKLLPRPRVAFKDRGVIKVLRLMIPALFGVSVSQINLLLDTLIASFLVSGSISWLYYSDRLLEFPVGLLGVAIGTVILPNLSRKHAERSPEEYSATLDWAIRMMVLLGVPAAAGLLLLAGPMLTTLFYSQAFNAEDVFKSSLSLIAYAPGLMAIILIKVLAPGFYAQQDTRTPVKIGIIAMVANMVFNIILVFPLAHAGLALATTLSSALNAYLLYRGLRTGGIYRPQQGWRRIMLRVLFAASGMSLLLFLGAGDLPRWLDMGNWHRILFLLGWILAGGTAYLCLLYLAGMRVRDFRIH
jgi:putative peptidoglycan lipid II flippase